MPSNQLRKDAADAARRLINDRVKAVETLADAIDHEDAAVAALLEAQKCVESARAATVAAGWKKSELDSMGLGTRRGRAAHNSTDPTATPEGAAAGSQPGGDSDE